MSLKVMAFSLVRKVRETQSGPRIHQSRDPRQGNSGRESDPGYTRSKHNILKQKKKKLEKRWALYRQAMEKFKRTPRTVPVRNF